MDKLTNTINEILVGRRLITTGLDERPFVFGRGMSGHEKIIKNIKYQNAYNEAVLDGIPTREDLKVLLEHQGKWTDAHDFMVKQIDESIEKNRAMIPSLRFKKNRRKEVLSKIKKYEEAKARLLNTRYSLFGNCAERYADEQSLFWNMHNMIYDIEGNKIWESAEALEQAPRDEAIAYINAYIQHFFLSQAEVRSIARAPYWRIYYKGYSNAEALFSRPACDLDDNQINLLFWSSVYDGALSGMEPPGDEVINDDTLFDAWVEDENKKYRKKIAKSKLDVKNVSKKSGNFQTVENFVFTDDQGAKDLYKEVK